MSAYRLDVAALYAALEAERERRSESWRDVAKATGVSPSTYSRMALKEGHRPDADALCSMLVWLGLSLRQFVRPREEL